MLMLSKNNDHKKKTRGKKVIEREGGCKYKSIGAHLKKHIYCKLLIKGWKEKLQKVGVCTT